MSLYRTAMTYLVTMSAGVTASFVLQPPAQAQANRATTFDPLSAYVGTWAATKPKETTPFLVLRLTESEGKLIGTISHFKAGVGGDGWIIGSPLMTPESPISDLTVTEGVVTFVWSGDPPLHGGQMTLLAEGTKAARLLIPVSEEEVIKIMSDSPGARGVSPEIRMRREPEAQNENRQESSTQKWEVMVMARLINAAEFQYRFKNGIYADYPTLVRTGELQKMAERRVTLYPKNLNSETNPLPGYLLRLLVPPDGTSYQFSIQEKTSAECAPGLYGDETGIVFETHPRECSAN
jgi:hypothetical protein